MSPPAPTLRHPNLSASGLEWLLGILSFAAGFGLLLWAFGWRVCLGLFLLWAGARMMASATEP